MHRCDVDDDERLDHQRALRRERQRRWIDRVNAHQTCAVITVDEEGLQAMIYAGLLAEDAAHLKAAIALSAQAAFDRFVAEQLDKAGYL